MSSGIFQRHDTGDPERESGRFPRILFIVENNTAPPDIRVWREARTAKHAGYAVTIISPKNKDFDKSYEAIDGIEIYRHPVFQ